MKDNHKFQEHLNYENEIINSENRCFDDLYNIGQTYKNAILEGVTEATPESNVLIINRAFDIFLYENLIQYERTETTKIGVLNAVYTFAGDISNAEDNREFLDNYYRKIQLYFDEFSLPELDSNNARDKQIQEILSLSETNNYRKKLINVYLKSLFEGLDEIQTYNMVNSILVEYQFDIVIPHENQKLVAERERIKNYIPDFGNVFTGQEWYGRNRKADFIKDLKLVPMPAGKNSRKAQERSILRSCDFTDDKSNQILTLLEIYETRKPKSRKRKYEPFIEILLLNALLRCENNILTTTRKKFFSDIGVLPSTYDKLPVTFYSEVIPSDIVISQKSLNNDFSLFHKITSERFNKIILPVLESLNEKSLIKYYRHNVIVTHDSEGNRIKVSIFDDKKLGYKEGTLSKMMLKAEQYAANQIKVKIYNPNTKKHELIQLKNIRDVMKYYKLSEYQKNYDKYINTEYGWLYAYEELKIIMTDNYQLVNESCEESKKELNNILIDAIKMTIKKKYEHREEIYQHEYEKVVNNFIEDSNIKSLMEIDVINQSSIEKMVNTFRYSKNFLEIVEYFIRYELDLDAESKVKTNKEKLLS